MFSGTGARPTANCRVALLSLFIARRGNSVRCCRWKLSAWPVITDSPPLGTTAFGISVLGSLQGMTIVLGSPFKDLVSGPSEASLCCQLCVWPSLPGFDSLLWCWLTGKSGSPRWFCYFYRFCSCLGSAHWKASLCWNSLGPGRLGLNLADVWDGLVLNLSSLCWHAWWPAGS